MTHNIERLLLLKRVLLDTSLSLNVLDDLFKIGNILVYYIVLGLILKFDKIQKKIFAQFPSKRNKPPQPVHYAIQIMLVLPNNSSSNRHRWLVFDRSMDSKQGY